MRRLSLSANTSARIETKTKMPQETIVTVFGSSRPGEGSPDYEEARVLGRALAKHGFAVCSGGYGGVMEAVSRGAKEAGGKRLASPQNFSNRPS